jgi:hypothetical protein
MKAKRSLAAAQRLQAQALVPAKTGRCNTLLRNGTRCLAPAGRQTPHVGVGPCYKHETVKKPYDGTARYKKLLTDGTIRGQLTKLGGIEDDVLDLVPEVQLLRTLVIDYVNRYNDFVDAILAWNLDREKNEKPRSVPDITYVSSLIEGISRIIERIHRIQTTGSIPLDTFRKALEKMGIIVARHVRDGHALDAIERDWAEISLMDRKGPDMLALPLPPVDPPLTP